MAHKDPHEPFKNIIFRPHIVDLQIYEHLDRGELRRDDVDV